MLSRGNIVHSQIVNMGQMKEKDVDVHVTEAMAQRMVPSARLLVWCSYAGEMLVDSIELNVDGGFANKVFKLFLHAYSINYI